MVALERGEKAMGGGKAASALNEVEGKKEWRERAERKRGRSNCEPLVICFIPSLYFFSFCRELGGC